MGVGAAVEGKPIGRRVVLGMLGLGTAGVLVGAKVQDAVSRLLAPVTAADGTGLTSLIPAAGRFRIYSVVGYLPSRKTTAYKLKIGGLVDTPVTLSYADLLAMSPTTLIKDFQCVTGWRVRDVDWVGVRLADLLDAAGVQPKAKAVTFTSFDGSYTESLTLEQARRPDVMVAYKMEGKGIPARHGGPVRLYVAPMYGYKSLKWLDGIEVVGEVRPGYWEVRGYDTDAWIGRSNGRDDQPV
jgi:DMSO/TMAO reductase YedYZ molybdopterin-dependent catalytic subunit